MNKNILIPLATLLLSIYAGLSVAQNSVPAMIPIVKDEEGTPIVEAEVTVEELSYLITFTDENGEAKQPFIFPSDWIGREITPCARKNGYYQSLHEKIKVLNCIQRITVKLHTLYIEGYVTDSLTGTPIQGATIQIRDSVQPPLLTTSDSAGYFITKSKKLLCKTPPKATIRVEKEGCTPYSGDVLMIKRYNIIQLKCTPIR